MVKLFIYDSLDLKKIIFTMEIQNNHQNGHNSTQIGVLMVPLPAQGHLNQLLHLSNLLTSYNISVHYVGSSTHNHQAKLRTQGWDGENLTKIQFHDFELPEFTSPISDPTSDNTTHFPAHLQPAFEAYLNLRKHVNQLLQELEAKYRRIVVIHDSLMCSVVQDVKAFSNAEAYTFVSISVFSKFFSMWEKLPEKPFELDLDFPLSIIPPRAGCFTAEFQKFADDQRKFYDFQSGSVYNTSRLIEGKYIDLFKKMLPNPSLKHFFIGPLNPIEVKNRRSEEQIKHISLEWLDKQELNSVIYVSFGSTTTMTDEQINELAEGLERSEQKFIWVHRNADRANIFTGDNDGNVRLPKGFENRVKTRGIVVKDWAPQLEILAHGSVGGFMSHCGWNSCMESISMGVPMAAWPMHSDQPKNSVLMTKVLGIGTMVREWRGQPELASSSAIENAVRILMASNEGLEMRKKAVNLGEVVRGAVSKGGACYMEREAFIAHISR